MALKRVFELSWTRFSCYNVMRNALHRHTCRPYSTVEAPKYEIRPMRRCDIQGLYELTSENNWNMEKAYLECVFNTDPSGLVVVVKDDGQVIGHNGILAHTDTIASSGMNIVKEEYRKYGIGKQLFRQVMDVMQDRNGDFEIVPVKDVNISDFIAYDSELNTVPRAVYISNWALWDKSHTYVALKNGRVCGYGVLRPADMGHRMYPLYADDRVIAKALFCKLSEHVPENESVIFSQPVDNEEANEFVAANNFVTYLSMTRLYNKWDIPADLRRVYSVSSTEYGIV